jgi:hypothetical protein
MSLIEDLDKKLVENARVKAQKIVASRFSGFQELINTYPDILDAKLDFSKVTTLEQLVETITPILVSYFTAQIVEAERKIFIEQLENFVKANPIQ